MATKEKVVSKRTIGSSNKRTRDLVMSPKHVSKLEQNVNPKF